MRVLIIGSAAPFVGVLPRTHSTADVFVIDNSSNRAIVGKPIDILTVNVDKGIDLMLGIDPRFNAQPEKSTFTPKINRSTKRW